MDRITETLESRRLYNGAPIDLAATDMGGTDDVSGQDDVVIHQPLSQTPTTSVPGFEWSSSKLSQQQIDEFRATALDWNENMPGRKTYLFDSTLGYRWEKTHGGKSLVPSTEGYLVATRNASDFDPTGHTELRLSNKLDTDFLVESGLYMLHQNAYRLSFDIRHPSSEIDWLSQYRNFSVNMQFFGPYDVGEPPLHPSLTIGTAASVDGEPQWLIHVRGDSNLITQSSGYMDYETFEAKLIPMGPLDTWYNWELIYHHDPFGHGSVQFKLDGETVFQLEDLSIGYNTERPGYPVGPRSPRIGMYSALHREGMEVHFDNIVMERIGPVGEFFAPLSDREDPAADRAFAVFEESESVPQLSRLESISEREFDFLPGARQAFRGEGVGLSHTREAHAESHSHDPLPTGPFSSFVLPPVANAAETWANELSHRPDADGSHTLDGYSIQRHLSSSRPDVSGDLGHDESEEDVDQLPPTSDDSMDHPAVDTVASSRHAKEHSGSHLLPRRHSGEGRNRGHFARQFGSDILRQIESPKVRRP